MSPAVHSHDAPVPVRTAVLAVTDGAGDPRVQEALLSWLQQVPGGWHASVLAPAGFASEQRTFLDRVRLLGVPVLVCRRPGRGRVRAFIRALLDARFFLHSARADVLCCHGPVARPLLLGARLVPRLRVLRGWIEGRVVIGLELPD